MAGSRQGPCLPTVCLGVGPTVKRPSHHPFSSKSAYKGLVLLPMAMDGAGRISLFAFGCAPSETNESWRFFVEHLGETVNIRDRPPTNLSDWCKGIDKGGSEFLPTLPTRTTFSKSARTLRGMEAQQRTWSGRSPTPVPCKNSKATAVLQRVSLKSDVYLKGIEKEH